MKAVLIGLLAVFGTTFAGHNIKNLQNEEYLQATEFEQRLFEGIVNDTINSIISIIAPFDPIHVDHSEIDTPGFHGEVTNLNAEGFANVAATHISLGGLITWTLDVTIEAPLMTFNIENWKASSILFHGDGAVSVKLENMKLSVIAAVNPITQYVKALKITPAIGNAEVSITGLYENPAVSEIITDFFNYILNDFINNNKEFHELISKILLEILQSKM